MEGSQEVAAPSGETSHWHGRATSLDCHDVVQQNVKKVYLAGSFLHYSHI